MTETMANGGIVLSPVLQGDAAVARAQIYYFLELALSHPGEDGLEWLRDPNTRSGFRAFASQLPDDAALASATAAIEAFLAALADKDYEQIEAAHINLFTSNFPTVACPPYGSLFTVEEPKRLEEMLAIKTFYHECGFDIAETFDDLPDHLCVELEMMHVLCSGAQDGEQRQRQAFFLDRFMLPFVTRLAAIASALGDDNPYSHLIGATRFFVENHRNALARASRSATAKEPVS